MCMRHDVVANWVCNAYNHCCSFGGKWQFRHSSLTSRITPSSPRQSATAVPNLRTILIYSFQPQYRHSNYNPSEKHGSKFKCDAVWIAFCNGHIQWQLCTPCHSVSTKQFEITTCMNQQIHTGTSQYQYLNMPGGFELPNFFCRLGMPISSCRKCPTPWN